MSVPGRVRRVRKAGGSETAKAERAFAASLAGSDLTSDRAVPGSTLLGMFGAGALAASMASAFDQVADVARRADTLVVANATSIAEIAAHGDRIDRLNRENAAAIRVLLEGVT